MAEEKKVTRRNYVKYAGAGIVVVAGAAAGAYYMSQPSQPPTPPTEKVTLKVLWEDLEYYPKWFQLFEQKNPDIKIEYLPTEWAAINDKVVQDNMSGAQYSLYDIVEVGMYNAPKFAQIGYIQPLDDKFITQQQKDLLLLGAQDAFIFEGKTYAVNMEAGMAVMHSNKQMLADAGFTRPPATYTEVYEYSKKLTKTISGRNVYGLIMDWADDNFWFEFCQGLSAFGGSMYDDKTGVPTFNQEPGQRYVEWMRKMYTEGLVNPDSITTDSSGTKFRIYVTGTGAITWGYAGVGNSFAEDPSKSTIVGQNQMSLCPGEVAKSTSSIYDNGPSIPTKLDPAKEDAVKRFLAYCFDPEGADALIRDASGPAPLKAVYAKSDEYAKILPWFDLVKEAYNYPHPLWNRPWFQELIHVLNFTVKLAVTGEKPVKDALDQGAKELLKIMVDNYGFKAP